MLLTVTLPRLQELMTVGQVTKIYAAEGQALAVGTKLFDLRVDLSAVTAHDCPPISDYRLMVRERAWVRRLAVRVRDEAPVGATLAELSTTPDEPLTGEPTRAVRIAVAGILTVQEWLDEEWARQ
jgi:hypothetical protein